MKIMRRIVRYVGIAVLVGLFLIGAALVATQTGWFKNYLRGVVVRQAAQYLNGTLTIEHLGGSVLTGIELDRVALRHEGETAIAIDKLTVAYDPVTLIRQGLILRSLTLDRPDILLQSSDAGWNFNRFVKTRRNTGGKGAPPLTIETLAINNGHVMVKARGTLLEDMAGVNARLRFAYQKPGLEFDIAQLSARSRDVNINKLSGNLRFEGGGTQVGKLVIQTDRSDFVTTFGWSAGSGPLARRTMDVMLHAERLWLPEVGLLFPPVAGIRLAPKVDVKGHGTLEALAMDVDIVSTEGSARGPLVGHFSGARPGLEGTLDSQNVNVENLVNRKEWKTLVTGRAQFDWKFGRPTAVGTGRPMEINFLFTGPEVQGFGYRAANVRAEGVYVAPDLKLDATGAAYGASASTHASFHFPATGPMSYTLAGSFRSLDMRRIPPNLSMPKLDTSAAGTYQFHSDGTDWRGGGVLEDAAVEGARFGSGTVFAIDSTNRALHYSASGTVAGLDPYRFAAPLDLSWLADDRFRGLLTGSFTFEGSGRTVDSLVLKTTADLNDSTLAGTRFPQAHVTMQLTDRQMGSTFAGRFEQLPASLFTARSEFADSPLNGTADASVTITIPATGPVTLDAIDGSAALEPSKVAGIDVDKGQVALTYANSVADIRQLSITGPRLQASAAGTLALGDTGESDLKYEIDVTDLEPLGKRFGQPLTGAAHAGGRARGPASQLQIAGTLDANRFSYSTTVGALAASSTYSATLPDFQLDKARIQADATATFATIAGVNVPRVAAKTTYQNTELGFEATFEQDTRTLGLEGRVLVHPDHHEVHLRALNFNVGETRWSLPAGQEATAQYSPASVTIDDFTLQRGTQKITATGTVGIGSAASTAGNNLVLRFENVQVRDINQLMLGQRPLDGLLNATAEVRGTQADPTLEATFTLTDGKVQNVGFESFSGTARYNDKAATVDVRLQQNPTAFLTAAGTVPVPSGPGTRARADAFDLAVKSSPIDVALFQPATTELTNLSGQLQADLHVGGTMESPELGGRLDVTNAGFTMQSTAVTYSNALARLVFERDLVLVDRFEVSDDDKDKLVAIGQLGLIKRTLGAMNMQLSASQFKVLDNVYGHVEVDADLRVTGDAAKPQITGTLSSPNARLEVDQLLEQLTKNPYSTQATVAATVETPGTAPAAGPAAPASAQSSALSRMSIYDAATMDVHLKLPDDLVLRGRDLQTAYSRIGLGNMNITVGGDLNIRKTPSGEPDIVGTISVVRGYYEFQSRRFDVLRDSQIRFNGLTPIDPTLQVDAQRQISGVVAIVNIRGSARHPDLSLSSQPPIDEADVLSLIVFNQPLNLLGEGERLNLAQRAGSLAAGYVTAPIASSIAKALDLDLFEIRPEGGINGQPSVALGQQFGSRLFVQFKQEFGSNDRSELSFEYRLSEFLRLVSTVAPGIQQTHRTQRVDTSGADLIFVLSY